MVDFVKIYYPKGDFILDNPLLDFDIKISYKNGEQKGYYFATYQNLIFKYYESGVLIIEGSLHYWFNKGKHNYNDFTFSNLQEMIIKLETDFKIKSQKAILQNIEFGLNNIVYFVIACVLDWLLVYKNKEFRTDYSRNYKVCDLSQYSYKIYNKSYQFELPYQVLRNELKFLKMEKINQIGVYTLHDLTGTHWIEPVCKLLLDAWDDVILHDITLDETKCEPLQLQKYKRPTYWTHDLQSNRMQRKREKEAFENLQAKHSLQRKKEIRELLQKKWKELSEN